VREEGERGKKRGKRGRRYEVAKGKGFEGMVVWSWVFWIE
jgi:hypothetical protein